MKIHPAFFALAAGLSLGGCGTSRSLPAYERPLAKTDFQQVRTTAYTHTEADHRQYGNLTALGTELHAAPQPRVPRAEPVAETEGGENYQPVAFVTRSQPFATNNFSGQIYGSAAADWSRWPAGTVFRIIATGQLYRVEDYGWALAGRNTIDLYMANARDMNGWGVRSEAIEIVQWGDPQASLRKLASHQKYRHIKRMVLELEGHHGAAARLR